MHLQERHRKLNGEDNQAHPSGQEYRPVDYLIFHVQPSVTSVQMILGHADPGVIDLPPLLEVGPLPRNLHKPLLCKQLATSNLYARNTSETHSWNELTHATQQQVVTHLTGIF